MQKVRGAFGKWLQRTVTKSIDIIIWRARIIRTSARAAWLVAGAVAFRTVAAEVVAQFARPEMSCGNGDNARPAAAATGSDDNDQQAAAAGALCELCCAHIFGPAQ